MILIIIDVLISNSEFQEELEIRTSWNFSFSWSVYRCLVQLDMFGPTGPNVYTLFYKSGVNLPTIVINISMTVKTLVNYQIWRIYLYTMSSYGILEIIQHKRKIFKNFRSSFPSRSFPSFYSNSYLSVNILLVIESDYLFHPL